MFFTVEFNEFKPLFVIMTNSESRKQGVDYRHTKCNNQ